MPLTIASDEVDQLAEKLASRTGVSKAEAVRVALVHELTDRALDAERILDDRSTIGVATR